MKRNVWDFLSEVGPLMEEVGVGVEVGSFPTMDAGRKQMIVLSKLLIDNGRKFRGERSPVIRICCKRAIGERDRVHVSVEDNGIGFDERYLPRIFFPF